MRGLWVAWVHLAGCSGSYGMQVCCAEQSQTATAANTLQAACGGWSLLASPEWLHAVGGSKYMAESMLEDWNIRDYARALMQALSCRLQRPRQLHPPTTSSWGARLVVLPPCSHYTLPVNQLSNSWYASLGLKAGTMWPAPRTVQNDMPSYSVQ